MVSSVEMFYNIILLQLSSTLWNADDIHLLWIWMIFLNLKLLNEKKISNWISGFTLFLLHPILKYQETNGKNDAISD